jgi:hypothetical protein
MFWDNGQATSKVLTKSSTPYRLFIENKGTITLPTVPPETKVVIQFTLE